MASISRQPNGRKTIQFVGADKRRRSIRLGKVSMRKATAVKIKVEGLVSADLSGHAVDDDTARWVARLESAMLDKLAQVGLATKRRRATMKAFLDDYMSTRIDVKPDTQMAWGHTHRNLVEFFGSEKPLRDITAGDAEEWRLWLIAQPSLSEYTIAKRCAFAKQFFAFAVKRELILRSPFVALKSSAKTNRSRFYFVSRDEAEQVLEACPDAQWRVIFALCRYGGLRCPSETLSIKWVDIDWDRGRILVRSPKTEDHPGGESRLVPLFPELRPYLDDVFEQAEPGAEYVITRCRNSNTNLRNGLQRIVKRAELKPWPKLFQNLRSTRETELAEEFPIHVICAWIENTEAIARKHYLQVTDEHFEKAVQNPVQQAHASTCNDSQAGHGAHRKIPVLQGSASACDYLPTRYREREAPEFEQIQDQQASSPA